MNTKELEKCLQIINYWSNEDTSVIDNLLNKELDIVELYIKPFSKELKFNLFNKDTYEAKRDLIKYYIFEFYELQGCYKQYYDIIFNSTRSDFKLFNYTNTKGIKRKLNKFENYVINSHELFDLLFVEIQICCLKYNIDFFELCIELNFPTDYIDTEFTIMHKDMQGNLLKLEQKVQELEEEEQTENDFTRSTIEDWLFEFKDKMSKTDYENLVSALLKYFDTEIFPTLSKPIQINGRLNKKLFGWALNRIFEAKGKSIDLKLLQFAKQNISLFKDVRFDENNILKSNLYKYFTTQTK